MCALFTCHTHTCAHTQSFMKKHNFSSVADFKGASLPYFTTHSDLVARQVRLTLL